MKVLITGSDGFIAKNIRETLQRDEDIKLYLLSKDDSLDILEAYIKEVDFIYHLAGVNRPKDISKFYECNSGLTKYIVDTLIKFDKKTPIVLSSSTQATLDNDYGKSKLEAENIVMNYSKEFDVNSFVFRLPNVFGKWSKPNYNSVISTWCYNISHDIDIQVNDENYMMSLVYVDDVVNAFVKCLNNDIQSGYSEVDVTYSKTLGEIRDLLFEFRDNRSSLVIPNVGSGFERALYATYLSYLDVDNFSYNLKGYEDDRGTFYEILKTLDSGQFSLSTTEPGIMRGNHYHHTKNEKFLVVKGEATIEFRHIVTNEIISYKVSDAKMEVVEMIPGYTHNIKNTGIEEMVLFLWANETFDQDNPDTYFLEV
jgi:UDP-2-acetamido-2,6-beta-L-arabino-hexul-4-ose reductase